MHDVWLLTRILLKNNQILPGNKKSPSKSSSWVQAGALGLLLCIYGVMLYFLFDNLFSSGFTGLAISFGLVALSTLILFGSIMIFPGVFYFSNDLPVLLPLPLKPAVIVAAKFIVVFISQSYLIAMIGLPMCIAAIKTGAVGILGALFLLLSVILCAAGLMLACGIVIMVLMTFLPLFANKDRFNLISGILMLAAVIGISILPSLMETSGPEDPAFMQLILDSQALINMVNGVFFLNPLAVSAAADGNVLSFLALVLCVALLAALFGLAASKLYLRAAAASLSSAPQKRSRKLDFQGEKRSVLSDMILLEIRELVRTPAFLINCVLGSFIMPMLFTAFVLFVPSFKELREIASGIELSALNSVIGMPFEMLCILAGVLGGIFLGGMNGVSATGITRMKDSGLAMMKSLPVRPSVWFNGIMICGFALSELGILLMLLPLNLFFGLSFLDNLLFVLGSIPSCLLLQVFGLCLDIRRPNLHWDNETAAVKQSLNTTIEIFGSWFLLVPIILLLVFVPIPLWISTVVIAAVIIILTIYGWRLQPKLYQKYLADRL